MPARRDVGADRAVDPGQVYAVQAAVLLVGLAEFCGCLWAVRGVAAVGGRDWTAAVTLTLVGLFLVVVAAIGSTRLSPTHLHDLAALHDRCGARWPLDWQRRHARQVRRHQEGRRSAADWYLPVPGTVLDGTLVDQVRTSRDRLREAAGEEGAPEMRGMELRDRILLLQHQNDVLERTADEVIGWVTAAGHRRTVQVYARVTLVAALCLVAGGGFLAAAVVDGPQRAAAGYGGRRVLVHLVGGEARATVLERCPAFRFVEVDGAPDLQGFLREGPAVPANAVQVLLGDPRCPDGIELSGGPDQFTTVLVPDPATTSTPAGDVGPQAAVPAS